MHLFLLFLKLKKYVLFSKWDLSRHTWSILLKWITIISFSTFFNIYHISIILKVFLLKVTPGRNQIMSRKSKRAAHAFRFVQTVHKTCKPRLESCQHFVRGVLWKPFNVSCRPFIANRSPFGARIVSYRSLQVV